MTNEIYVIDTNVPVPAPSSRGRAAQAPHYQAVTKLEVGQSFFAAAKAKGKIGSASYVVGKKLGRTYTVRNVDGGIRIWRIK